jgi:hypothetical protein
MDLTDPVDIARQPADLTPADLIDADLAEVEVAISLVAAGAARRVSLVGLRWAEIVAPTALAHAQAKAVGFRIDRTSGAAALIFGDD